MFFLSNLRSFLTALPTVPDGELLPVQHAGGELRDRDAASSSTTFWGGNLVLLLVALVTEIWCSPFVTWPSDLLRPHLTPKGREGVVWEAVFQVGMQRTSPFPPPK